MSEWEQNKKIFIEKLDSADKTFLDIFKADKEGLVIQGEEREKLQKHCEANKKILKKLQNREFTVAVVGLEKAGKSTLGDALIKSMVLPEYSERCTYTTTEIRAGNADIAEIYFYSREEFNKNFKRMLNEVKYSETVDFFSMTLETFKRYWQAVETDPEQRGLFLLHNGTTAEDVKAMLEGKQKIISLLGKAPKKYEKSEWGESDEFTEFKTYITGMSGKNDDGSVIREPYPYAVKNVIIRSTELGRMDHIVLYDVPGFDSPTELHKRQTEEMLKESDAIILVTNVGDRPNLTGTQLDMLRKGQDRDGIKLSAKCFVFGNKIDRASDYETAKNNLAALKNEAVNKYQIALDNHIVGGSARAYLEKEGLMSGNVAEKIIEDWQPADGDGIKVLQEKMQSYYDNERFEVLKQRAEKTLSDTREVLQNMLERYSGGELNNDDAGIEIVQVIQSKLPKFVEKANEVTKIHTNQVIAESPFTNSLKGEIEEIYPLVNDENGHNKLIEKVELSLAIDPDGIYPTTAVNGLVRDKLSKDFIENIVVSASKLTAERQKILRQALITSFLEIMGMEQNTIYKTELENSVDKLFDEMLIEGGSECKFNSLVERFVTTLIQTLILNPFATNERCDKVKATLAELVALSVYYNMPEKSAKDELHFDDIGKGSVNFFAKILAHEGIDSATEIDSTENENFLRKLYEENKDQICKGVNFAVDFLPFGKWAKLLMKSGINLAEMQSDKKIKGRDKLDYKIEEIFYNSDWEKLSAEQRKDAMENVIKKYQQENLTSQADDESLTAQLDNLHERAKKSQRMKNKAEMIATLDSDIEILRDITAKSVLNAIGLERAFISVVTKNVELIREHLQDEKGGKAFRDWVRLNSAKLMPSKFESIIENKAINENRKAIVSSIKNVLANWEM